MEKIEALAAHLEIVLEDGETLEDHLEVSSWDENEFSYGRQTYLVLTDDEADEKAGEYIKDSLWAFNADFLASETDLPVEVFEALQPRCEDANDAITALVERSNGGLKEFIENAISADGRGHFMNSYDGQEHELGEYYIYRTN